MDDLLKLLNEVRPDVDFKNETGLVTDKVLDSFDIITIVSDLNEAYDIEINVTDLQPENFDSAGAILKLVERLS